jgi:hypothetical protein
LNVGVPIEKRNSWFMLVSVSQPVNGTPIPGENHRVDIGMLFQQNSTDVTVVETFVNRYHGPFVEIFESVETRPILGIVEAMQENNDRERSVISRNDAASLVDNRSRFTRITSDIHIPEMPTGVCDSLGEMLLCAFSLMPR